MEFSIGDSHYDALSVKIIGYERSPVGEYYDDNWVKTEIRVRAGGFVAKVYAAMLTSDFVSFAKELQTLSKELSGCAKFATMEDWLSLTITGDKMGRIRLQGEVVDRPGTGNRLHFGYDLDQSYLAKTICQLDALTARFPERIQPNQSKNPTA